MKSKTSFFNMGICLNYLKRCWPLWAAYAIFLYMIVPGNVLNSMSDYWRRGGDAVFWRMVDVNRAVLSSGHGAVGFAAVAGVAVAMAMFSFLYNNRSSSMICSLPVRRETVFITAYLTGLVPMLVINVVIAMITAAISIRPNLASMHNIWLMLLMMLLSTVAFYSFAVFCAVLTGNIVVLPAVYGVLNIAVVLAEQTVCQLLGYIVYGFRGTGAALVALSPIAAVDRWFYPVAVTQAVMENGSWILRETGAFTIEHFSVLVIYAVVGLLLAAAALWIYRRRQMETAGDVVAVPILRPIFRYCMCFGVAVTFAVIVYESGIRLRVTGFAAAMALLLLMILGGFIGYYAAEMMMQKSLRVFGSKRKGFVVSALLMVVFVLGAELDVLGYEKRVPAVNEIESVSIRYVDTVVLEEQESLAAYTDFHRQLVAEKEVHEGSRDTEQFAVEYAMKDGSTMYRSYQVDRSAASIQNQSAAIHTMEKVVNLPEAILKRISLKHPMTASAVYDASLDGYYIDEKGEHHTIRCSLSPQEAAALYQCIQQDAKLQKVGRLFPIDNEEYFSCASTVRFSFCHNYGDEGSRYYDFVLYVDAPNSSRWVAENTDIELLPIKLADRQSYENLQTYDASMIKEPFLMSYAVG